MEMTIDEAIKHCEEVAKEQRELFSICPIPSDMCDPNKDCASLENGKDRGCIKCAEEHEQLAEWLKELKQLREQLRWIPMVRREPTDEEKAEYLVQNGEELGYMMENEMPLNGQEVLVSVGGCVSEDVFAEDFYNFENNDIENVDAWMPLPKSYEPQESERL